MPFFHLIALSITTLFFASAGLAADEGVPGTPPSDAGKNSYKSVEERRLFSALEVERRTLENERAALEEEKKNLKRIQEEVDKRLDQLKQQRLELERLLAEKDAQELKRVKDLSKMYEKMAAEKAARVFNALDQQLAVSLLENMKTKAAARILNNMDRERAAALTTAFSTLETQ